MSEGEPRRPHRRHDGALNLLLVRGLHRDCKNAVHGAQTERPGDTGPVRLSPHGEPHQFTWFWLRTQLA
jgi:hypothetical protein